MVTEPILVTPSRCLWRPVNRLRHPVNPLRHPAEPCGTQEKGRNGTYNTTSTRFENSVKVMVRVL